MERLKNFLRIWDVIEILFDSEWSRVLLDFWRRIDVGHLLTAGLLIY